MLVKARYFLLSLGIHAVVAGAIAFSPWLQRDEPVREIQIPVYFFDVPPETAGTETAAPAPEQEPEPEPEQKPPSVPEPELVPEPVPVPEQPPDSVPEPVPVPEETPYPQPDPEPVPQTGKAPEPQTERERTSEPATESHPVEEPPGAPGGEVEHAEISSAPSALNRITPAYPRSARRRGQEGDVTVEILVDEDGVVAAAEIVLSSGHASLDAASLDAVRTARFAPAMRAGANVPGRVRLTFGFRLKEDAR